MLKLDPELNKDLICELKKPLGKLYPDFNDAIKDIKSSLFLISVGDETLKNLIASEITPNLAIIDNLIQRKYYNHKFFHTENILDATNPAGTITDNLWETIDFAIKSIMKDKDNRLIVVDGEEDLAVLPCILTGPDNATILYGQPNEGLVLLKVSDVKEKAQLFIDSFTKV